MINSLAFNLGLVLTNCCMFLFFFHCYKRGIKNGVSFKNVFLTNKDNEINTFVK